jgi:hypothetical protein
MIFQHEQHRVAGLSWKEEKDARRKRKVAEETRRRRQFRSGDFNGSLCEKEDTT